MSAMRTGSSRATIASRAMDIVNYNLRLTNIWPLADGFPAQSGHSSDISTLEYGHK
jgi:hypothetical protein